MSNSTPARNPVGDPPSRAPARQPPPAPHPGDDGEPIEEPPADDRDPRDDDDNDDDIDGDIDGDRDDEKKRLAAAYDTAIRLLTRREHTVLELRAKLARRGYDTALCDTLLTRLRDENLQSDARFAEVYTASRADKGYGPLRLRGELAQRGVSDELIERALGELDDFWDEALTRLAWKKFRLDPDQPAPERHEQARQTRFFRQRGFMLDRISALYRKKRG